MTAPAGSAGSTRSVVAQDAFAQAVLVEINAFRRQHRLGPVRSSRALEAAANRQSAAMASRGFFAHESEYGSPFWKRILAWYSSERYRYWSVGQNLLWVGNQVPARAALRMWLSSRTHRKILLMRRWREVGVSAVYATAAPGFFRGRDVTIVTANFGVRR
jgi:uncharacterized protein YkwD